VYMVVATTISTSCCVWVQHQTLWWGTDGLTLGVLLFPYRRHAVPPNKYVVSPRALRIRTTARATCLTSSFVGWLFMGFSRQMVVGNKEKFNPKRELPGGRALKGG
jgi:hypothetical protein